MHSQLALSLYIMQLLTTGLVVSDAQAAPTTTTTTTPAPPLPMTYHCEGTSSFVFDVAKLKNTFTGFSYAIASKSTAIDTLSKAQSSVPPCSEPFSDISSSTILSDTLTGCDFKQHDDMQLYLIKTNLLNKHVFGGGSFKTYGLPCDITADSGLATVKMNKIGIAPAPPTAAEIPDLLQMEVVDATNAHQDHFNVGQRVTVKIELVHTSTPYYLEVQTCTATNDGTVDGNGNEIQLVKSGATNEPEIIPRSESLNTTTAKIHSLISFDMFAFKFQSSTDVYLQCTVKVCKQTTCGKRRRRRNAQDNSLGEAAVHFTVGEKTESSSGEKLRVQNLTVMGAIMAVLYAVWA